MIEKQKGTLARYPCSKLYNVFLTDNQIRILIDIAINGPVDAYREHKRTTIVLSTTQNILKKLSEYDLIKIKEISSSNTDRIRKIYQLTSLGFFASVVFLLDRTHRSTKTYEDFHKFIQQNRELFPYLLEKWDELIENTKEAYRRLPERQCKYNDPNLIPFPDSATNYWCVRLLRFCESIIEDSDAGSLSPEQLQERFSPRLVEMAKGGFDYPDEVMIEILKKNPVYLEEMKQYLHEELEDHKEQVAIITKLLEELR